MNNLLLNRMENKKECPVCYDEHPLIKGGRCTHEVCNICLDQIKYYNGLCPICREYWGILLDAREYNPSTADVELVASQADVSHDDASRALQRNNGDIISAIMELSGFFTI